MEVCSTQQRFAARCTYRHRCEGAAARRVAAEANSSPSGTVRDGLTQSRWWRVVRGVKIALRTGPSHSETLCGSCLEECHRFLVLESVSVDAALANGAAQIFLRLAPQAILRSSETPAWAFVYHRKTGQPVCEALSPVEAQAEEHRIAAERLLANDKPVWALRRMLLSSLLSAEADVAPAADALSSVYREHGWQPPPLARREGGLWMLTDDQVASMRRAAAPRRLAQQYDAPYYERMPPNAIPRVDLRRATALPREAAELLRSGTCCLLQGHGLWDAAATRWGRADFLQEQLAEVS